MSDFFKQQKAFKQKNVRFYEEDVDLLRHIEHKEFTKYVKELIRRDLEGVTVIDSVIATDNGNGNTIATDSGSATTTIVTKKRKISRSSLG